MDQLGLRLVEGRLPRPRSNEIAISKAIAMNRGLHVGDTLGHSTQQNGAADSLIDDDIPIEMTIVGLLSRGDLWLGLASLEYLESHELTAQPLRLLVLPVEGRKAELDAWLETNLTPNQAIVDIYDTQNRQLQALFLNTVALLAMVECIIAVVAAVALAALNYIFFSQRREEFGILHAVGHSRPWLVFRTVKEIGSTVGLAWLIGAAVCGVSLVGVRVAVYAPLGLDLDLLDPAPWLFTLPIPLAVIAASAGTVAWTLSRLDPVSIVERR